MKKILKFTTLTAVLVAMILCMVACSSSGDIESINDHDAIYRYMVKEVQLVDKESNNVLTTTKDFKFYYGDSDAYKYVNDYIYANSALQYYFPDLHIVSSSGTETEYGNFCKEYNTKVYVRAILNKVDQVHRPTYEVDGVIATVKYSEVISLTDGCKLYKGEVTQSKFENLYDEYRQKYFELCELENDEEAFAEYEEELMKEWNGYACILSMTETVNLCQKNLKVEYKEYSI